MLCILWVPLLIAVFHLNSALFRGICPVRFIYTSFSKYFFHWMDEWMDGWTDGRTDGWMDGWMDGWIDRQTDRFFECKNQQHRSTDIERLKKCSTICLRNVS